MFILQLGLVLSEWVQTIDRLMAMLLLKEMEEREPYKQFHMQALSNPLQYLIVQNEGRVLVGLMHLFLEIPSSLSLLVQE